MNCRFIDNQGTFVVKNPSGGGIYFPLTNKDGTLLSSICPNLAGDLKHDNEHFLTPPASVEDLKNNLLCRREFFLKVNGKKTLRLSSLRQGSLQAGILYHKLTRYSEFLKIEVLSFIPFDKDAEIMQVTVTNESRKDIKIQPTSFIPLYGRSEKNLRDHRHVSSLLNRVDLDKFGIYLKPSMVFDEKGHSQNRTIYFVLGYEDESRNFIGQFPTLDYFCGQEGLLSPLAIEGQVLPVTQKIAEFDGKEACAAFRFRDRVLKAKETASYCLLMGISRDLKKINDLRLRLNTPVKIKKSLQETKQYWQEHLSQLEFDFKNRDFNNWLLWVKLQPILRKLFGCSFLPHFDYGKGGRGWRDIWQDALTLLLTEPKQARGFILNNFKGVRIDGSNATIITRGGGFISDRNRISRVWMDHGIWPYLTTRFYIDKTGDLNLLLTNASYFKDAQLKRSKEIDHGFSSDDYLMRTKANRVYQGSILEHILIQNLVQFFNVGEHNIIRLENGDWNDGLDMAGQKGESVVFSFMYAHNLRDLCFVLKKLNSSRQNVEVLEELGILLDKKNDPVNYLSYKEKQKRLEKYLQKTEKISGRKIKIGIQDLIFDLRIKSEHLFAWLSKKEWLGEGFFNGYYDNKGRRVEGRFQGRIRMMLASQVFAIMSGGATNEQVNKIYASLKRHLQDKKSGGFRLNTDFKDLRLDLGRSFGFSYGDKENGAFFSHMAVMLANALYKRGFSRQGLEVMSSIYKMATDSKAKIYPMIPEYFNNSGQGLYPYLTGSASWYIYTILEEILGIKFIMGDLVFEPRLRRENFFKQDIEVRFKMQGKNLRIIFIKSKKDGFSCRIEKVLLNGKLICKDNKYIIRPKLLKNKENFIRILLS